jgi:hypothetical protein
VLLRSTTDSNNVAVPSGLEHLVLSDDDLASMEVCKWSLSGPGSKTKKNGALQQRYSYPRGRPEYSDFKGVRSYHFMSLSFLVVRQMTHSLCHG